MRLLASLTLLFASGCSCDFGFYDDDWNECSADSDCVWDDDGEYCNGTAICDYGAFGGGRSCIRREPDCWRDQYCDELSDSCRACESPDDAPECAWLDDAGRAEPDAGPDPEALCGSAGVVGDAIGSSCGLGRCAPGLDCVEGATAALGPTDRTFTHLCSTPCDPSAAESGCAPCAACIDSLRVGDERISVSDLGRSPYCAPRCEPSRSSTGCERVGFSCDVITGTCQDACTSDEDCRLVRDELGTLVEDPTRTNVCDGVTGRCRLPGTPDALIGGPCVTDAHCPTDGVCLRGDGWPDTGYCARLDCQWPELRCGAGEQCHHRAFDRPACLVGCTVGAEPEADQLGAGGHGAGCAPGLSCRWDGRSLDVSPNGGCMPGNYNDVVTPNLGEPCTRDDECHSPLGLGRCAGSEGGLGVCTLIDCGGASPAIACGDGATCVPLGDDAHCLRACTTASECAAGHACAPAPSGSLVCAPSCTADTDCRTGERCDGTECTFDGACRCVPM